MIEAFSNSKIFLTSPTPSNCRTSMVGYKLFYGYYTVSKSIFTQNSNQSEEAFRFYHYIPKNLENDLTRRTSEVETQPLLTIVKLLDRLSLLYHQ